MNKYTIYSLIFILVACSSCSFEGTFNFLREPPNEKIIPGIYTLSHDSYSADLLKSMKYKKDNVTVILNTDKSFEIFHMPDCWLTHFAESKGGYDSCKGRWSIYKSYSVYTISLSIDSWSADSTFLKENKMSGFEYTGAFTLTKENEGYGLALPLESGDKGYIYFLKKHDQKR